MSSDSRRSYSSPMRPSSAKKASRPLSANGERSGTAASAAFTHARSRVIPSNPVSSGDGGATVSRLVRNAVRAGEQQVQLSWYQQAGRRPASSVASPGSARGNSGRLKAIQARRLTSPSGTLSTSSGEAPAGRPGTIEPRSQSTITPHHGEPAFHSFGIMGRSVSESTARSSTVSIRTQSMGPGLVTRASSFGNVNSGGSNGSGSSSADLQKAMAELDPVFRQAVPGLTPTSISSDGTIMCTAANQEGRIYVQRTRGARSANPERLNLDHRNLAACCTLLGEERLRLLNYQHNNILSLADLGGSPNLVFLDLYSNCISDVTPLKALPSLRVLMLGRNNIKTVEGLSTLPKLDVLDLHNNLIETTEGLSSLQVLRILNLAGNQLQRIGSISSLTKLAELNLRRNFIASLYSDTSRGGGPAGEGSNCLPPQLQRLFLSHNRVLALEEIAPLGSMSNLQELAMDGNPIASACHPKDYRRKVLTMCPEGVRVLDLAEVSEDENKVLAENHMRRQAVLARIGSAGVDRDESDSQLAAEVDTLGYGVNGTAAKLQQSVATPANKQQSGSIAESIRQGIRPPPAAHCSSPNRTEQAIEDHETDVPAVERQAGADCPRSAALSPLPDEVTGELSHLWADELETDSESELEAANLSREALRRDIDSTSSHGMPSGSSQTDLLLARRRQQQSPSTSTSSVDVSLYGPAGLSIRPVSGRAFSGKPAVSGEVKRMYREGSSHFTAVGMDNNGHADGYSEVFEDGRKLQIYGKAAERLQQPSAFAAEEVSIFYLPVGELEEAIPVLAAMGNLTTLAIDENNIHFLHQLNFLAALTQLISLSIGARNPVSDLSLFRPYVLSRLPQLHALNNVPVREGEATAAQALFSNYDELCEAQHSSFLSAALSFLPEPSGDPDDRDGSSLSGSRSTPSLHSAYQPSYGRSRAGPRPATSLDCSFPGFREAATRASEVYTEQMLRQCGSARRNLDLFEQQWAETLAGIASESLNAMS